MAFVEQAELDILTKQISSDLSLLGKLYKAKKSLYHQKSVSHDLLHFHSTQGWEEFGPPLKTKTKVRKLKSHKAKFVDDVWAQLYELGFRQMSLGEPCELVYSREPLKKKKIDIIAVNDDCVLLVDCHSSEKPKKPASLKSRFEELPIQLLGMGKVLEKLVGKKKIKYIYATRNLRLDRTSTDINRLLDAGAFYYNDNTYDYVKGLLKSYKSAAHYQFLALLFKGQLISKERIEVPAIQGSMGGKTYYMFSIEPHLLLKMGFVLHRTRANEAEMPTYQRLLVPSRLKGITKFIKGGGYFPNSVILNFGNDRNKLQFEAANRKKDSRSKLGTLKIPNAYAIAYIIDGQHRVYGYAHTEYKVSNTIPVVAFEGLRSTEQLEIFMDINENQKAVSATLRITLEEDLYWNSERADSRMKALRSSIIQALGGSASGPLYNKISIGEDKAALSANPFANAILQSGLLPSAKGNQINSDSLPSSLYHEDGTDRDQVMHRTRDKVVGFINNCYQYVEDEFPDIFTNPRSFVISNRGTFAFICLIGSVNAFESERGAVAPSTSADERFEAIKTYLKALLKGLQNLPEDQITYLWGKLGSGSENVWLRSFQNIVNKSHPEYEPEELIDWKERQDTALQEQGRKLGTATEKYLKKKIIENLKALFGDNWDIEIGQIKRDCQDRAEKEIEKLYKEGLGRKSIPWTDMFFIADYKTIVEKYWTKRPDPCPKEFKSFDELFAIDVGKGFNSKAEKVKWLSIFNSYRNNWAHEGTKDKGLNKEEVQFLQLVWNHIFK